MKKGRHFWQPFVLLCILGTFVRKILTLRELEVLNFVNISMFYKNAKQ